MPWIQLSYFHQRRREISDALMEAGAVLSHSGYPRYASVEPLPGEARLWGDTDVIGLFDAETDMNEVVAIQTIRCSARAINRTTGDKGQEREWMDNFRSALVI